MSGGLRRLRAATAVLLLYFSFQREALAQISIVESPNEGSAGIVLERVIVRFTSPDTGGTAQPRFVLERELAFAARLEALGDKEYQPLGEYMYLERHVRGALESHVAETLLASHTVEPPVEADELLVRVQAARMAVLQRVGGILALNRAARAEGVGEHELHRLFERRARASLYLDRMVSPMLTPSETELRVAHRATSTPYSGQPYERVAARLRRWYVAERLRRAVVAFYEGARNRVRVTLVAR